MNKIKRFLAGSLAVMMAASVMTACGKDEKKNEKGFDAEANAAAAKVGKLVLKKADRIKQEVEGSEASKKTLKIYTWNEEFKDRLRAFYPEYDAEKSVVGEKEYLKDGTEIVWVTTANENNAYQNKLDEDLAKQAKSDDKIDIFLVEADYALKYVNGPYTKPVSELGVTDADLGDMYEYTKTVCTDANGDLQGVSWQATPGLFAYRRDIATEVLGTDDPAKIQEMLSDWTKFDDVAKKMKDAGYYMLSGYDDAFRTFSNNVKSTWVNKNLEIVVDDNILNWIDQTKKYTDEGYHNGTSLWAPEWSANQGSAGKVFGFFYSTWGIDFTLKDNAQDNVGEKDGLYGKYAVCEGPQSYYWGGTWIIAADGTDNPELVGDIMKKLTCDATIAEDITNKTQDFTNSKTAMEKLAASDFQSEFLGGQNHIALFAKSAPNIDISNMGPYDQGLNEAIQSAMKDYFTGKISKDKAFKNFYTAAIEKYPELKKPASK